MDRILHAAMNTPIGYWYKFINDANSPGSRILNELTDIVTITPVEKSTILHRDTSESLIRKSKIVIHGNLHQITKEYALKACLELGAKTQKRINGDTTIIV